MIFKTTNSSVDETRKTLALFNKDWDTYKRNWQNANGVIGKIGSVFTPANAITKSDIEAIKAYNSQIDSCVTSQTAFNRTMLNASPAAQNLVASYNGGKVSAQGMATAQNMAETSTIRLTIAQTALSAAIGMGIGLLISLVVKGIDKLVHANEEAIEKAEELRKKYEEFKSTNESNVTTLKGLEKEFEELSKGVSQYGDNISLTTEQYERYKEIIQQIVGMSPSLAEGYSTENGYIADKNGLLERAIELQEQEYRNELRKITNLDNLKTSMSGYIAEYKDAFEGGWATEDMSATSTVKATDFSNALYKAFNYSERYNDGYSSEDLAREILKSLGIDNINKEMEKFFNENGYYQPNWFFEEYVDEIAKNIDAVTNVLSYENVGLDEDEFENRILTVKDCAQAYLDMKDSISMANESIQADLRYIAEYADGYDSLSSEQQKFVNEFLKGFNIDDITSRDWFGNITYDEDKMKSVKRQINDFVEALSQNETTKEALADLYAIPTDEQSIEEFVEQFRSALEIIKTYCKENGIEVPIAISDSEQTVNDLEAQYQRAVDFAKDKFNGYDPTAFFKENSINTQEEIDKWLEIAQATNSATEAEKKFIQNSASPDPSSLSSFLSNNENLKQSLYNLSKADKLDKNVLSSFKEYDELLQLCNGDVDSLIANITQMSNTSSGTLEATNDLSTISGGLDSLSEVYSQAMDGFVESSAIQALYDQFGDLSIFENFAEALQNIGEEGYNTADAFNSIADAYISSKISLDNLTDSTKAQYIEELRRNGITNAQTVVEERLAYMNQVRADALNTLSQMQGYAAYTTQDLINASVDEVTAMINNANAAGLDASALQKIVLAKMGVNSVTIDAETDVNNLIEIAKAAGVSASMIAMAESAKHVGSAEAVDKITANLKDAIKSITDTVDVGFSPYEYKGSKGGSKKGSGSNSSPKTSKTLINWIERRINVLTTKAERWAKIIENATNLKRLDSYYKKLESNYKKQVKTYSDSAARYLQKANSIKLDNKLKNKVKSKDSSIFDKDGSIKSYKKLIKEYGEKTAKKIQDYQNWYEKYESAIDGFIEATQKLYQAPIEKAADKIELLSDSLDLLDAKLDNISVDDYEKANDNLKEQNKNAQKQLEANQKAAETAQKNYDSTKSDVTKKKNLESNDLAGDKEKREASKKAIKKAISNGKEIDLTLYKEGSSGYKAAVKYNAALKAQKDATDALALSQEEYTKTIRENTKAQFDNVQAYYESQVKLQVDYDFTSIDNTISEIETAGKKVNKSYYESQKNLNEDKKKLYEEEKAKLEEQIADITQGTKEWYDAKDAIQECANNISDCVKETYELNNAINELHFSMFQDIADDIDRIITEQEFLQGLFSHEKNVDEGTFTKAGIANLGSESIKYYLAKEKADNDKAEVEELQHMFDSKSLYSEKLGITFNSIDDIEDKLHEMYSTWQDDIKETYNYESEIADLMKEKYQAELDWLQALIDSKTEALNTAKDLHDYQRSLREKTTDINTIKKQIAAYQGDSSQEGLAKLQKLQSQLTEAKEDLKETEYERYISDQQDMLSKLSEEAEEIITKKLDDFSGLVKEGLNTSNENTANISKYIETIASNNQYNIQKQKEPESNPDDKSDEKSDDAATPSSNVTAIGIPKRANWGSMPLPEKINLTPNHNSETGQPLIANQTSTKLESALKAVNNGLPALVSATNTLQPLITMPDTSKLVPVRNTGNTIGDVSFNFELPNVTNPNEFVKAIQNDTKVQKAIRSVSTEQLMGKGRLNVNKIR